MKKHIASEWTVLVVLTAMLSFTVSSCTDDFMDLNSPPHLISEENIDVGLLGQAFAQSQYYGMYGLHWRFQISQSLFSDLYSQYFATTAENFDSDQYVEVGRWIDLAWRSFYEVAAPQAYFVETFSEEEGLSLENAIAKVWRVQIYHRITDYWGPIIYSQFGNGETSVSYDSQQDVYMDFFDTLDEAVTVLEQNRGGSAFASHDQVYGGSADHWLAFANSLRLRLAMRIRYVDPGKARIEAEKAVTAGVMMDNSDGAFMLTTQNSLHPHTTITNWGEFRMSSAMESLLEGYDDPRIGIYFSPAVDGDSDGDGSPYEGLRNGLPRIDKGASINPKYSDIGVNWLPLGKGGVNPSIRVMGAAEVYFLRAEGALQGWNMGGSAEELYNEGIRMSLTEGRIGADAASVDAYIANGNLPASPNDEWESPPLTDIPVAFDSGASSERQLEQIVTQKWLALFPDGWEAYAEYRRTGYPDLYPIIRSSNPDVPEDAIFRRMTFVSSEYSNNQVATEAAVSLLNGPDRNNTKLWWDAK